MKIGVVLLICLMVSPVLDGEEIEHLRELTREIQMLNLLNGFELSGEQTVGLKRYVKEVEELEDEFKQYLEDHDELFETALERSIEILSEGGELPPALKKQISSHNQEVRIMQREMEEAIHAIAQRVEKMLEPHQIQQLRDYVPCLIPPPGKARIGQSGTPEGIVILLERIRDLPDDVFVEQRSMIVEKAMKKKRSHMSVYRNFDEKRERQRIEDFLDRLRAMDDIEFALEKESLAGELKDEMGTQRGENDVVRKIRSFLLDPVILKHL